MTLGDTIEIFDRLNKEISHTWEKQARDYTELFDSLIRNPGILENVKIFFFSMDPSNHDRYYPSRIRFGKNKSPKYLRQNMRAIYTIIDTTGIPLPAYYTILKKIKILRQKNFPN